LAFQLLRALQVVHARGLIHRDVSPGNVLLAGGVVKLIDFQTVTQSAGRPVRGVVGTPCYQAPEMWAENGYDSKVDIWSAGTVLTRAVKASGRVFSEKCYDFLAQCTNFDASQRPSASEALRHPWFS
jgi:serine/threonine protein kinase